jgi:hypothetical protein
LEVTRQNRHHHFQSSPIKLKNQQSTINNQQSRGNTNEEFEVSGYFTHFYFLSNVINLIANRIGISQLR